MIYLDYAAATPMADEVLAAMHPYWQEKFYNPSAASLPAKAVKKDLEQARSKVAHVLGARPAEIIFTAGGTEANNLAIFGVTAGLQPGHIITTAIEHDSVLLPIKQLAQNGWKVTFLKPDVTGLISVEQLVAAITPNTVLVSVMYANNEVGTIQPIKHIAEEVNNERADRAKSGSTTPLYFHSDAAQAANYLDIHVHRQGVDLMTFNGGKIYGPKQSGALFVRTSIPLEPQILGGGQESGKRSGTENVAGCIGFAAAVELAATLRSEEVARLSALQKYCLEKIAKLLPSATINGSIKHRLPNNIHLTLPGADNERLLYGLEEAGVICAIGSACSASNEEASHVLIAMGISQADARSSLRLSFGRSTTQKQIDYFIDVLKTLLWL